MTVESQQETLQFQTEVNQLLHLMVHSLYSNKEIFLRELISNASDACDKLRFEALSNDAHFEGDSELKIQIEFDEKARTITVRDNGIGMSREEVIQNIGTIAKSGTREFFTRLTGDKAKDSKLIGEFGVGFYSSFVVADGVTLTTRRAGLATDHGVRWFSDGKGAFSIENVERAARGTEVSLRLRKGEDDFLNCWRLRSIITKYSDHIALPVLMRKEDDKGKPLGEWEMINKASALWARPKSEISDDEYKELYKHIAHDFEEPLAWMHSRVEGRLEYISLLYIPKRAPFDLFDRDRMHGVKLYVRRVFIMDDAEQLMPRYLRFVRGVIDSNDLPLNISREILQSSKVIDSIRSGSVKKVLSLLGDMADKEPDKYQQFWDEFGRVIKEGPGEDFANRDAIAKLLRFSSTHTDDKRQTVSLADYIARMKPEQDKIYYITADNIATASNSPHLEIFRKKEVEVLLMYDRVDEWLVSHLAEFDGKKLQSVAKGELDLGKVETGEEKEAHKKIEKEAKDTVKRIKEALGDKVADVRVSHRLTNSPACIVLNEHEMALYMQHLLKQAGHETPATKPVLEINPTHPIVERMKGHVEKQDFNGWAELLFEQAVLAEGGQLENPAGFVARLNALMLDMVK
ncbi:MAG: molecular chaperone HtpG [Pseudomonadota bacterium]|nr:molecular chaperone HtpG [Pseudomonadota bacterium]